MSVGKRGFASCLLLLLSAHAAAAAVSIQYTLVPLGGNVYKYIYTVTNTGGPAVQLFDIQFDPALYQESSLQPVSSGVIQSQWSEQILHSVPPLSALYDACFGGAPCSTGGIAAGSTVTGFAVQFTWLGPGIPGAQPFQIIAPGTFTVLQTGTTAAGSLTPVPTASMISLMLLGLGLAGTVAYQLRPRNAPVNR